MFGRNKSETPVATVVKEGGKGRRTPTRKEAEAAAKARARGLQDKKGSAKQQRARRADATSRAREGMRRGEEQYLPKRDKGPVRRFVRDYVDARLCMAELLLPMFLVLLVAGSIATRVVSGLYSVTILLVALDTALLLFRLRRELRRRFPDQDTRGASGYAVLRTLQLRFMRLPKPQVKLGGRVANRS